jgi:hypothetical protein
MAARWRLTRLPERSGCGTGCAASPGLDPRTHKGKGFDPVVYVTTLLFSFTSGGDSLADAERLEDDESLKMLLGVKKLPDQSAIGEWLRNVGEEGAEALRGIIRDFCAWAMQKADRDRLLLGGELEWFFDDTQIEVNGKKFEGAAINYNGDLALSWQTLWAGPFICDAVLGTPADHKFAPESCAHGRDVSAWMPEMLERCAPLGRGFTSHLYADSASSAGHYLAFRALQRGKWMKGKRRVGDPLADVPLPSKTFAALRHRPE